MVRKCVRDGVFREQQKFSRGRLRMGGGHKKLRRRHRKWRAKKKRWSTKTFGAEEGGRKKFDFQSIYSNSTPCVFSHYSLIEKCIYFYHMLLYSRISGDHRIPVLVLPSLHYPFSSSNHYTTVPMQSYFQD